jgi:hypothetical protein
MVQAAVAARAEVGRIGGQPEILLSQVDHRQPVLGDHGIRFAAVDAAAAAYAEARFRDRPRAEPRRRF